MSDTLQNVLRDFIATIFMDNTRWKLFLDSAYNPPSLTTQSPPHVSETLAGIKLATKKWDRNRRVLVLGCGDGLELDHFRDLGFFDVTGVTNHPTEVAARQDIKGIVEADIHELPFGDASFDYVYSKETLEHLLCPFMGVYESVRVMKKGGRFAHLISTGPDKQREPYHFSCLPDWVWADLFFKCGAEVRELRRLVIGGHEDIQTLVAGIVALPRDLSRPPNQHYSLTTLLETARQPDIVLI